MSSALLRYYSIPWNNCEALDSLHQKKPFRDIHPNRFAIWRRSPCGHQSVGHSPAPIAHLGVMYGHDGGPGSLRFEVYARRRPDHILVQMVRFKQAAPI